MSARTPEHAPKGAVGAVRAPAPPPDIPRESRRSALKYWLAERKLAVGAWTLILCICVGGFGLYSAGAVDPMRIERPRTSFGTEGANVIERGAFGADIEVGAVGSGLERTYIIREKGATGPQPAVIFLHGFGSSYVIGYEGWLEHLAHEGLTVIFPSWQQAPYPIDGSQNPRVNMFRGVELAVKAVPIQTDKVATMGFSAGASLAYDYAALGGKLDVPKAKLVYSVYPGRAFPGEDKAILPLPPPGGLDADAKVVTLVSRKDEEVGIRWGVQQYESMRDRPSDLRDLVFVTEPGLGDHFAPGDVSEKARRVFWQPFDRLLRGHLNIELKPDTALKRAIRQEHIVEKLVERESIIRKEAQKGETSVIDGGAGTTETRGATPKLPGGDSPDAALPGGDVGRSGAGGNAGSGGSGLSSGSGVGSLGGG